MRLCPQCNRRTRARTCEDCQISTLEDHTRAGVIDRLMQRVGFARVRDRSLIGETIDGRYKVTGLLGAGGMGEVYRGHLLATRQDVAIKVMKSELARDESFVRRFFREALAASRLSHPNVVKVSDFGQLRDGRLFMVMEFLSGQSLREAMRASVPLLGRPCLEPRRAAAVAGQVARALHVAHREGVVHRDLKPENVFLVDAGDGETAKVVDFGISKFSGRTGDTLTSEGVFLGTPSYASPEQARGKDLDGRSDLYSLGVMMYEMLCGRTPFSGREHMAMLVAHVNEAPPPLLRQPLPLPVPEAFALLVHRMIQKDPARRPAEAREVLVALSEIPFASVESPPLDSTQPIQLTPAGLAHARTPAMEVQRPAPEPGLRRIEGRTPAGSEPTPRDTLTDASRNRLRRIPPWAFVTGGLVILGAMAFGGWAVFHPVEPGSEPGAASVEPLEPRPGTTAPVVAVAKPAPVPPASRVEPAPAAAPAPVVPARRVVELSSRPSGALVLEDGEEKGTTPYRTDLEPARTRALVLRSPGFEEKTVRLSSSTPDRLEVSMKPLEKPAIPARAAPRPPKPPKTTPAKSPAGRPGTDLSVPD